MLFDEMYGSKNHEATHFEIFSILLLLPLRPKHLRQHPILEYHQRMFLPQRATTFVPGKETLGIPLKFGHVDCLVLSSNFLFLLALLKLDLSRKFQKCGCVPVYDGRQ